MTALHLRLVVAPALALLVASCAVAPPKVAPPVLQSEAPLAGLAIPAGSRWPASDWWRAYADPQLDTLMAVALHQSPDLAEARARVAGAEQSVRLAAAQAGLRIDGSAQVSRQRMSEHGLMPPQLLGFSWYNQADLGVQFRYDFDWWGKQRAAIASAVDQARAAEAQRSAAALAIQNAVADTYFGWLADEARLALATQAVATQQQLLKLTDLRVAHGVDMPDTAAEADSRLAAARQVETALQGSAQIRRLALAALLGVTPATLPPLTPRPLPAISAQWPADARIDLAARRPDIAASRWQVEAALRQTDVARARFFPDFSITALAGLSSTNQGTPPLFGGDGGGSLANVFKPGSRVFGVTPALHLPIFEGGQLKAAHGISQAQLDAAVAQYDAAVFHAAREAGSQALAAQQLAAQREQQHTQVAASERLYASAGARLQQGVRDARESLASRAQLLQQQDQAVALHAQALSTDLALIQALGGGYRMPPIASPNPPRNPQP